MREIYKLKNGAIPSYLFPPLSCYAPQKDRKAPSIEQQGSGTADSEFRYGLTQVDCI